MSAGAGQGARLTRRTLLTGAVLLPAVARLPRAQAAGLPVRPRSAWAAGLPPTGRLLPERDVRFLLVHHTASRNTYTRDEVRDELRGFFRFHTGPEKGWPDLAYNFMVDRFGGVWEGRAGSLQGAVQPSATGGSQGFAQLACYIGDHRAEPPTPAARASMLAVLASLAERHDVDTSPGATTRFASRGSSRWAAGTPVVTRTLAGHRDMSDTSCPGEEVYADLRERYPVEVSALRATHPGGPGPTATRLPRTRVAARRPPPTRAATTTAPAAPGTTPSPVATTASPASPAGARPETDPDHAPLLALGASGAALAVGAALAHRRRRGGPLPAAPPHDGGHR